MISKKIALLGCALLMCSPLAQAGLVIEGCINGNTGSTSGSNGTGVNIGDAQKPASTASQRQNDIYASICASPFMKKYASICQ
ncbi:hypothetical protein [Serratia marcescens]|uniref:hypothetical protein n=1 Tax=Serratia marcescens TaxID=615 RepID=UPI00315AE632